jgi:ADP-ribose pyrophosphatase
VKKVVPFDAILIPKEAKLVFSGKVYDVYQWDQILFDGSSSVYEMLRRGGDTAITIAVDGDKILLIKDEQSGGVKRIAFPGGRIEDNDSDTAAGAKREVHEETGYSFKNWRLIKVVQPSNETEWFIYIYLAWDVEAKGEMSLDPGERIEVMPMSFNEVKDTVMHDSGTLGRNRDIFQDLNSIDELLDTAEFEGQTVDI